MCKIQLGQVWRFKKLPYDYCIKITQIRNDVIHGVLSKIFDTGPAGYTLNVEYCWGQLSPSFLEINEYGKYWSLYSDKYDEWNKIMCD